MCTNPPCEPSSPSNSCWYRVNGCSASIFSKLMNKQFEGSCNIHDLCYGKQGRSKQTCDNEFYENMKNQCRSENYPLGCWATARAAYIAVKYHANAQHGYDWGQKHPC